MSPALLKKLHLWGAFTKLTLFRVNTLLAGTKHFEKKRRLLNQLGFFLIGDGTKIVGPVEVQGTLTVGKNCWIGKNFRVNGNGSVTIGDNCDIGPEVTFMTGSHRIGQPSRRAGNGVTCTQSVGSCTWLGGRCTIVNNTAIGDSCVVAACACVTKDVAPNTLVGGVPAKTIQEL